MPVPYNMIHIYSTSATICWRLELDSTKDILYFVAEYDGIRVQMVPKLQGHARIASILMYNYKSKAKHMRIPASHLYLFY